nr:MAG TPA: hypothetical protein [Caudoviricetes sp.]
MYLSKLNKIWFTHLLTKIITKLSTVVKNSFLPSYFGNLQQTLLQKSAIVPVTLSAQFRNVDISVICGIGVAVIPFAFLAPDEARPFALHVLCFPDVIHKAVAHSHDFRFVHFVFSRHMWKEFQSGPGKNPCIARYLFSSRQKQLFSLSHVKPCIRTSVRSLPSSVTLPRTIRIVSFFPSHRMFQRVIMPPSFALGPPASVVSLPSMNVSCRKLRIAIINTPCLKSFVPHT